MNQERCASRHLGLDALSKSAQRQKLTDRVPQSQKSASKVGRSQKLAGLRDSPLWNTLIMFYKGQSLRDARRNFVKNKGQGLALRASRRDSKNWIHAVSFIRDTVILRLVLSLNLIKILTSFVPYLSLISTPIIDSEALH